MRKLNAFTLLFSSLLMLLICNTSNAQQHNLQALINQLKPPTNTGSTFKPALTNTQNQVHLNSVLQLQENSKTLSLHIPKKPNSTTDTIYVGISPNDTLIITGTYT